MFNRKNNYVPDGSIVKNIENNKYTFVDDRGLLDLRLFYNDETKSFKLDPFKFTEFNSIKELMFALYSYACTVHYSKLKTNIESSSKIEL